MDPVRLAVLLAVSLVLATAARPGSVFAQAAPSEADLDADAVDTAGASAWASLLPDGLMPPDPPAVLSSDEQGRVVVRAVRIQQPLRVDGRIDDEAYVVTQPIDRFVQQVPREGEPATERTEAWVFFDDVNFYVAVRCWESDPSRITANELRRDSSNIINGGDSVTLAIDTFYDKRNGFVFQTNPLGAVREQQIADGRFNESWNTIWQVKSSRFAGGWSTEMMIPFKSLRYRESGPVIWGINLRRVRRWSNEIVTIGALPAAFGSGGIAQMQMAAPLVGLVTPPRSRNIELKPYGVSSVVTDNVSAAPRSNDPGASFGGDFKYGLTRSLIADFTYNTDFAQIEEDVQQVNLTRFNVLFPEKRDFFLEGQGIYEFGGRSSTDNDDVPVVFFSRQIGLDDGQPVPVVGGGRLTGKQGPYDIAALNIQTGDKPSIGALATNFSALRVKRDILSRSNIGMIATMRNPSAPGQSSTATYGVDASFRLTPTTTVLGYFARADTPGTDATRSSFRGRFEHLGDRYGVAVEHLGVDRGFEPSVGYTRRTDFRRSTAYARFSPRPRDSRLVRKLTWEGTFTYYTDAARTQVQNRSVDANFNVEFHSGDQAEVRYTHEYELLPVDFAIASGVTVAAGGYQSRSVRGTYWLNNRRRFAGRLRWRTGSFYDGTRQEASYTGRVSIAPRFALEPGISLSWVDLPAGAFTARLLTNRFMFTPTPRMQVSSLVQKNLDTQQQSLSVRLRWEYILGSELFVVFSDGRDTSRPLGSQLLNRTFAVKITRLLRF
ncbi:MAG: DUF5916 domain-containing protein [Vicinamibacterales bacterium]